MKMRNEKGPECIECPSFSVLSSEGTLCAVCKIPGGMFGGMIKSKGRGGGGQKLITRELAASYLARKIEALTRH